MRQRTEKLAESLRGKCKDYTAEEVGTALTIILLDFATFLGIPKKEFLKMIDQGWDLVDQEINGPDETMH
jgi:hypothetical protein